MGDRTRFFLRRLSERLWIKPLVMCVLSIAGVFLAGAADYVEFDKFDRWVPDVTSESIEALLSNLATSMLVIATFAVGSMISAYASAGTTATPRSFSLILADDVSQNALSTFIGTFIFSIVALVSLKNDYYDKPGRFVLFVLTATALAVVVLTLVKWVDRIARLGRMSTTIDKVEAATAKALRRRREAPHMKGVPPGPRQGEGLPVYGDRVGYVQLVDIDALQTVAEKTGARISVAALPGTFCSPGKPLAYVAADAGEAPEVDARRIAKAFRVEHQRTFDEDPRFGLVALSEIANRALSPAVNDPGTAISIIGVHLRLFSLWKEPVAEKDRKDEEYDRVEVPGLSEWDMFDDAFTPIARSGAGSVEVVIRLLKAFQALASMGDATMRELALHHSHLALARAEKALSLPEDLERVRNLAKFEGDIYREA